MFDPETTVLLPIDMQLAFDGDPWPPRWNAQVDTNGLRLLHGWRSAGLPILHVRHDSAEPGSTLRVGAPGHAARPGFDPQDNEPVVAKSVNAAFIGTDLDLQLRRRGIVSIVAFGISTDMCVSTTIRVGANLGYRMIVAEDACDCFDLPDGTGGVIKAETVHKVHLATLRQEFASIVSVDQILHHLRLFP